MNLHEQLKANSLFKNENMLDDMTEILNRLHDENEKKNDQWIYDLQLRKKMATVRSNIEIVKKSIYTIIK